MNPANYSMAKNEFVEGYKKYQKSEDLTEMINLVVIPYFEPLACDLEELVDIIRTQTDESIQVLDYLELVFNSKLYDSYLGTIKLGPNANSNDNYSHYLVILIEFTKYQQYQDIKQKLKSIESKQEEKDKSFIQDLLMKATEERSQYCLDKIKHIHNDLTSNHTSCYNSIAACQELFNANNISFTE